jgi:hypothetical protein
VKSFLDIKEKFKMKPGDLLVEVPRHGLAGPGLVWRLEFDDRFEWFEGINTGTIAPAAMHTTYLSDPEAVRVVRRHWADVP